MAGSRIEKDSFGPIEVPADRLWGAQTERSRRFFRISGERMPLPVIYALARIKKAAAAVNTELGLLDAKKAQAIQRAYWSAQEKAPRALAAEATSARLRAALTAYADELAGRGTDVVPEFVGSDSPVLQALTAICDPSPQPR